MAKKSLRDQLYMHLAIGKKQLCWDDDFYRDVFLVKHGAQKKEGRISASTMQVGDLSKAVEEMKAAGYKPGFKKENVFKLSDWRTPRINKIKALWHTLAAAGVVNANEAAMLKWCARISGKPKLEWATAKNLNDCIESLKAKAQREGVRLQH